MTPYEPKSPRAEGEEAAIKGDKFMRDGSIYSYQSKLIDPTTGVRKAVDATLSTPSKPKPAMSKPLIRSLQWAHIEDRYQKPMRQILLDQHAKYPDNWEAIAREFGVTAGTVRDWWTICSLPEFGANDDGTVTIVICGEVS